MNLRGIANGITASINPNIDAVLRVNDGYTVSDAGKQIPQFTETHTTIQTQSMSTADLEHLGFANQQGQFLYAYANGRLSALRRSVGKGSEQLVFASYGEDEACIWVVKQVVESYPSWVKVVLWRQ